MADAATIGANFSSYQGNVGLGGGTFGSGRIDTRPVEDLGRYIMLYNKAEFDQRQKDAESTAKEIADMTSYDLTSPIKKDADHLQNKYDKLLLFVRDNPNALDYRNKEKWAQYKSLRNDLENDLRGAKVRKTMYDLRLKEIADEPIVGNQKLRQQMLDKEVEETDIRTPLKHSQKYDVELPEMPTGKIVNFDTYKTSGNMDIIRDYGFLDMRHLNAIANAYALDLNNIPVDLSTPEGQFRQVARGENFWLQGANHLNKAIKSYKTTDGKLDESKLDNTSAGIVQIAKEFNNYVATKKSEIKAGVYRDKFQKPITFGSGMLNEADYKEVNYEDGVSPEELAKLAAYAKWHGDTYKTKPVETDDAIQQGQLALGWARLKEEKRQFDLTPKTKDGRLPDETAKQPAILFGEHVERLKNWFNSNSKGKNLVVPYGLVDDATRKAVGLEEDHEIVYKSDGSYVVRKKGEKEVLRKGTIENIKKGYIDAVKSGSSETGVIDETFLTSAESTFGNTWGTTQGQVIWNNWGKTEAPKNISDQGVPTYKRSDLKKANWTDEQIQRAVDAGKIKVQ